MYYSNNQTIKSSLKLVQISIESLFVSTGFFVTLENIPFYMHWMSYVAYTRYGFEGTMLAIYGYDRDTLTCSQVCSPTRNPKFLTIMKFSQWPSRKSILF